MNLGKGGANGGSETNEMSDSVKASSREVNSTDPVEESAGKTMSKSIRRGLGCIAQVLM